MKTYQKRYAFLTTYNETLFLKQSQLSNGEWVLWYSNPIFHDTVSNFDPGSDRGYRDCVSIRECFLYFFYMSNSSVNCVANNRMDNTSWTSSTRGRKLFGAKSIGKHITDREVDGSAGGEVVGEQAAPQLEESGYRSIRTAWTAATFPHIPEASQNEKKGPLRSLLGLLKRGNRKE